MKLLPSEADGRFILVTVVFDVCIKIMRRESVTLRDCLKLVQISIVEAGGFWQRAGLFLQYDLYIRNRDDNFNVK